MAVGNKIFRLKLRTLIFGHPLATRHAEHTKVGILGGIPIFGSDLISSQGYAPDAIMSVLLLAGALGYAYTMKVSLVIIVLLASIFMVFRKAIQKFPQGGGAYNISKNYLGDTFGLIAGASLTLDYILTVAVSVSSAIENLSGIFVYLRSPDHKVLIISLIIIFMGFINLRGLKESAKLFALPVYLYLITLLVLIATGIFEVITYGVTYIVTQPVAEANAGMTVLLFARAVASGTTALTGFEAVSDGVTAFKTPSQNRAISTLLILAIIVGVGLIGLTYLASVHHLVPSDINTILNQLGLIVFGQTIPYYLLMGSAAAILIIAANTPFAGLPILLSLMARDGNAPRYFKNLGDRMVYSSGIWTLMVVSIILVLIFKGSTHMMLPLYAIGVFISFSLTGLGLAKYTFQNRGKRWQFDFIIFSIGGGLSFLAFLTFLITKFTQGAFIIIIALPILVFLFRSIGKIYRMEIAELHVTQEKLEDFHRHVAKMKRRRAHNELTEYRNKIIVPAYDLNLPVLKALKYAYSLTPLVTAVHVASDPERTAKLLRHWGENHIEIPLEIIESPFRAIVHDLLSYIDKLEAKGRYDTITIALPEYVPKKLRYNFLHNQTGHLMKLMLLYRKSILVTSIPYHQDEKQPEKNGKSS